MPEEEVTPPVKTRKRRPSFYMALAYLGTDEKTAREGYETLCTGVSPKACKKQVNELGNAVEFIIVRLHGRFKATPSSQKTKKRR